MEPRAFGWEQIADCGAMRVVGLRLLAGQRVPEHRNAIPVAVIVTEGELFYREGSSTSSSASPSGSAPGSASGSATGSVRAGELVLVNPGERHSYWAEEEAAAYLVFAGLPGRRADSWTLRRR